MSFGVFVLGERVEVSVECLVEQASLLGPRPDPERRLVGLGVVQLQPRELRRAERLELVVGVLRIGEQEDPALQVGEYRVGQGHRRACRDAGTGARALRPDCAA